jgi:hypothetical protein
MLPSDSEALVPRRLVLHGDVDELPDMAPFWIDFGVDRVGRRAATM